MQATYNKKLKKEVEDLKDEEEQKDREFKRKTLQKI